MKIALVHDQLNEFGGAERVLVALKNIFSQADIFTTVYTHKNLGPHKKVFNHWKIYQSWFGKIPLLRNFYSPFRFLTPLIWEGFNFSKYDLVISSSGSWMAKGIKTRKPTIHIAYIHHPPRYLYGYETAIEWQKYWPIKTYAYVVNHFLRMWDYQSSQRPDFLIANSQETRRRIQKFYRRDAWVIYPPVRIPKILPKSSNKNFYYLTVSRLARAKHIDILIKAANKIKVPLKIVGTGRDEKYLHSISGSMTEFLGSVSDKQLQKLYLSAKAFLFASVDEEFGIAPLEAMGYGLPVIAYRSGGIPEYLTNEKNGLLFDQLNEDSLIEKIKYFERFSIKKMLVMKKNARKTAENFSEEKFKKNILKFINKISKISRSNLTYKI